MNTLVNCFTFPPDAPFLRSLAEYALQEYGADAASFTKLLILLPNRRSCLALRDEFLDATGGKPLLLPRIQPIGEVDEDFFLGDGIEQPIDQVRHNFLLTRLVLAAGATNIAHAVELARELASLMDEVNRAGLSFDGLSKLAPENLASHWQQTLDFLTIISRQYPMLLEAEETQDAIVLRNKLLAELTQNWLKNPPDFPIIAAGSTGSQPATANLLKTIARLPLGRVILPALDTQMPEEEWNEITDTHPQFMLKKLLENMGLERDEVKESPLSLWERVRVRDYQEIVNNDKSLDVEIPSPLPLPVGEGKIRVIRTIFSPPAVTANWSKLDLPLADGLDGIKIVEAETQLDEAKTIAIALRQALETPQKTAALVTPDRTLARMVAAQMQRFGVIVDDSAGKPLNQSPPACFLRLVLEMVASRFAPAPLLAVLRHPLTAGGIEPALCRKLSRELELSELRGIRKTDGLSALVTNAKSPELGSFLTNLQEKSANFTALFAPHYNANFKEILAAHIEFSEWLAVEGKLWAGEAGNSLSGLIANWNLQGDILPAFDPLVYPALFEALLAPETYRSQIGLHPRLHILSPMEARLQQFDMVIMGGLNEGTWPKDTEISPWMSRPQRKDFGLPSHEQAIGKSAHDAQMLLLSSPEILLTRARKVEGSPTIPSRFLVRLQTLIGGKNSQALADMNVADYFNSAKNILEIPAKIQALTPPAPNPPISARPRSLRVTAIDKWLRNPYDIYAQYILNLRALEKLDREPDFSDLGNIIHSALEHFTRKYPSKLPENVCEELLDAGQIAFADFLDRPAVEYLWWTRFANMANWLVEQEKLRRTHTTQIYSEVKGVWKFAVDGKDFTLSTRIDRLEKLADGYAIIDYKTGTIPTKKERELGLANQLPLEALVVMNGELIPSPTCGGGLGRGCLEYWKLSGNAEKCEITEVEADLAEVQTRLENLIREYDNPQQAYTAQPDSSLIKYSDYGHLTRRKEWELI